jgi:hypothetical protein
MSALGQKQTCAVQKGMSALPPKADMCSALFNVGFGPEADIGSFQLLDFNRKKVLYLLCKTHLWHPTYN